MSSFRSPRHKIDTYITWSKICKGSPRWLGGWSSCSVRRGWGTGLDHNADDKTKRGPYSSLLLPKQRLLRRPSPAPHCSHAWRQEKKSPLGQLNTETGCPERLWSLHPWRLSRPNWTKPQDSWSKLKHNEPHLSSRLDWMNSWGHLLPAPGSGIL